MSATLSDNFATYITVFYMNTSDNQTRIVFDLGLSNVNVLITEIRLEELTLVSLDMENFDKIATEIFPTPFNDLLNIYNYDNFYKLTVSTIQGQVVKTKNIVNGEVTLNLDGLPAGLYLIALQGDYKSSTLIVIK